MEKLTSNETDALAAKASLDAALLEHLSDLIKRYGDEINSTSYEPNWLSHEIARLLPTAIQALAARLEALR